MGNLLTLLGRLSFLSRFAAFVPGLNLLAPAASIFSAVVQFFCSPVGKWVGVALIALGLFLAGDIHRARLDRSERAAEIARADQARTTRDAEIRKQAAAAAAASLAQIQTEADGLKKQVADYESYIAAHGGDALRATPDVARRLRGF